MDEAPSAMGYMLNAAFALEFDWPMFGQLCGIMPFLGVVALVVGLPVLWACDFEFPLAAANATPPPASDATATASARMRFRLMIPPPFDACLIKAAEAKDCLIARSIRGRSDGSHGSSATVAACAHGGAAFPRASGSGARARAGSARSARTRFRDPSGTPRRTSGRARRRGRRPGEPSEARPASRL